MLYMTGKYYRIGMGLGLFLSQVFLLLMTSAFIPGAAGLEANEYGEIDDTPEAPNPATSEEAASPAVSEGPEADEEASEPTVPLEEPRSSPEADGSGEGLAAEIGSLETNETTSPEEEAAEPTMAEAIVYVFNRDDDTLSISLFIDSELAGTEEVSKDKEKKFGSYELEAGSHDSRISWWDDDTKMTYQEDLAASVEGTTAVTLYAAENTEPEEFEVTVMLRNDNDEDLEAYLYIDGLYEKMKTAKKTSTTDFGKFDMEEGTHVLAVRWQDPATKIEYEKRKTLRVDGKDAVTFYAPAGMAFEGAEEAKQTTSSKTSSPSSSAKAETSSEAKEPSSPTKGGGEVGEASASPAVGDQKERSSESRDVGVGGAETVEKADTAIGREAEPHEAEESDSSRETILISALGAILAIYLLFFRR